MLVRRRSRNGLARTSTLEPALHILKQSDTIMARRPVIDAPAFQRA
jgi:hypothetical protein